MTHDWSKCYQRIESLPPGSGPIEAWLSAAVSDQLWDEFLQSTPCGQFQQSSMWAEYKAGEGWMHHRVILTDADGIIGGFQILWKKTKLIRIGYVSKGPVLRQEMDAVTDYSVSLLCAASRDLDLSALIVQPPDESQDLVLALGHRQFLPNKIMRIISTTLLINLTGGMESVIQGMNASARMEIKQAKRRGTIIRDGSTEDINGLFNMMVATCERQKTNPNPATEDALRTLWERFRPMGARLMIARCRGVDVAGQLCIPFGERVTIWKKGWNGQHRDCHPNRLLNFEGLVWACEKRFRYWDFAALDPEIAANLLSGRPLSEVQKRSRDMFHLGFGGEARLLPASCIWINNSILRFGYKAIAQSTTANT